MATQDKYRVWLTLSIAIFSLLLVANLAFAKMVTFEKEYTYQASEIDSKVSCRAIALEQVKRLLLEELGTYVESNTEVKDFQLTKDQITTLTAGLVEQREKVSGKIQGTLGSISNVTQLLSQMFKIAKDFGLDINSFMKIFG